MKNTTKHKKPQNLLFIILVYAFIAKSDDGSNMPPVPVISNHSEETMERMMQIEKLNADESQVILAEFALNDSDIYVRFKAVNKLTVLAVLAIIAKNDREGIHTRRTAIKK